MAKDVVLSFKLPVDVVDKDGLYVACCSTLDVYSQGGSLEEAKKNLVEALTAFIQACLENASLEEVLRECGLKPVTSRLEAKKTIVDKQDYVDVPIELLFQNNGFQNCHT